MDNVAIDVKVEKPIDIVKEEFYSNKDNKFVVFGNSSKIKNHVRMNPKEWDNFESFAEDFKEPQICEKGEGGYFLRANNMKFYSKYYSNKGKENQKMYENIYPRCNMAINSAWCVIGDVDNGLGGMNAPSIEEVHKALVDLNLNHFIHTTSSHNAFQNKLRFIIPCKLEDEEQTRITTDLLMDKIIVLGCNVEPNPEQKTWSQPWYAPTRSSEDGLYQWKGFFNGIDLEPEIVSHSVKMKSRKHKMNNNDISSMKHKSNKNTNMPVFIKKWEKDTYSGSGNAFDGSYEEHFYFLKGDKCSRSIETILDGTNMHKAIISISVAFACFGVDRNECYDYLHNIISKSSADSDKISDRLYTLQGYIDEMYFSNSKKAMPQSKNVASYISYESDPAIEYDINSLIQERKDIESLVIPPYKLDDLSLLFLENYKSKDPEYRNMFCNMLKGLNNPYTLDVFTLLIGEKGFGLWNTIKYKKCSVAKFISISKPTDEIVNLGKTGNKVLKDINILDKKHKFEMLRTKYKKVLFGGSVSFVNKVFSSVDEWEYKYQGPRELAEFCRNHKVNYFDNNLSKPKTKNMKLLDYFYDSLFEGYEDIVFYPRSGYVATKNTIVPGKRDNQINVYHGLNCVPCPGEWKLIYNHIFNIICRKNEKKYNYLMNMWADMFQNPAKRSDVVIAFQGTEGCGKNTIMDIIDNAFGFAGVTISDPNKITGDKNATLSGKVCLILNEAIWEGDKKNHSKLKDIITSNYLNIRNLYKDTVKEVNHLHIFIMTNHNAVAPMSVNDRRISTYDVSEEKVRNFDYFGKLHNQINNGGAEAFIYALMQRDVKQFNPREMPVDIYSKASVASKFVTSDDWVEWLYECLIDNRMYGETEEMKKFSKAYEIREQVINTVKVKNLFRTDGFDGEIKFSDYISNDGYLPLVHLYASYCNWSDNRGLKIKPSSTKFTRFMRLDNRVKSHNGEYKLEKENHRINGGQFNSIKVDCLDNHREWFEGFLNEKIDWTDG